MMATSGQDINPVVECYITNHAVPIFGVLRLGPDQLVFSTYQQPTAYIQTLLRTIRWIGIRSTKIKDKNEQVLLIQCENSAGWQILSWHSHNNLEGIAHDLAQRMGLRPQYLHSFRDDYGPQLAYHLIQDIYGVWHEDRQDDLYLAPDRLIFNNAPYIRLDQVQEIRITAQGDWEERQQLLQIDYQDADGKVQMTAYLLDGAENWAAMIHSRIKVPIHTIAGRKKKKKKQS